MRLTFEYEHLPPLRTTRTRRQFLWFPKELSAGPGQEYKAEIRWLEWAYVHSHVGRSILGEHKWYDDYWHDDYEIEDEADKGEE